jgi:iron complex transport system substrate-binding protein
MRYIGVLFFFGLTLGAFLSALFPPTIIRSERNTEAGVRDMSGRQVPMAVPARRVVIFPPVSWDYITVDEGAGHILAVSHFMQKELREGLLGRIYPESTGITTAFTSGIDTAVPGDPEAILIVQADAILSWAHFSDSLKNVGLPVAEVRMLDSVQGTFALYRLFASMSGKDKRVEKLLARYQQKCSEMERKVVALKALKKPAALFLWVNERNSIYVTNQDSSYSRALHMAGGENQARNYRSGVIDLEQLLLLNPDVIFVGCTFGIMKEPKDFYGQPQWQTLSAVKNRRVYVQPMGNARMDGPVDEPLLQLWMAKLLYPNQIPGAFRGEFKAAYEEVYRYSLSDDEIDRSIFLKENLASRGYERFARSSAAPTRAGRIDSHERIRSAP